MRLAVLCAPDSWYFRDLARAAGSRHEIVALPFTQIAATAAPAPRIVAAGHDLASFDAVLVRTMPPGTLEQVVFRMNVLAQLAAAGVRVVNSPRSIEVAVDKYLASARLHAAGLDHPATIACQTWEEALAAFHALERDVVVKPLFGAEGRGITRVSDEAIALRVFKTLAQFGAVIYLQAFVPHNGYDIRVLVIGERMFAMRRINADDWRTNVSRGARTEPLAVTPALADLARRAAQAVGAELAGVDILPTPAGRNYLLEVNAVPGWKALARTTDTDIAAAVLNFVGHAPRA